MVTIQELPVLFEQQELAVERVILRSILLALTAQGAKAKAADVLEADDLLSAANESYFDPTVTS
jgi:hypothetical protein